jgi:ankyrin repeat protein
MSVLRRAVGMGDYEECQRIITTGVDLHEKFEYDNTVLHYATHNHRIVELLLLSGADPNSKNNYGSTPLHCASAENNLDSIRVLVTHNAQLEIKDCDGWSPLYWATYRGIPEAVEALLSYGANPYSTDNNGDTIMVIAKTQKKKSKFLRCLQLFEDWEATQVLIKEPDRM